MRILFRVFETEFLVVNKKENLMGGTYDKSIEHDIGVDIVKNNNIFIHVPFIRLFVFKLIRIISRYVSKIVLDKSSDNNFNTLF